MNHAGESASCYRAARETKETDVIPDAIWLGMVSLLGIKNEHPRSTDNFPSKIDIPLEQIVRRGEDNQGRLEVRVIWSAILVANMRSTSLEALSNIDFLSTLLV